MGRFDGKVVLVTGAARGQGQVEARLFAEEGASVVATDILPIVHQVFETSGIDSKQHLSLEHDSTNPKQWHQVVENAVSTFGRIDVLVNNAGVTSRTGVLETLLDEWDRVMDVNAKSVLLGMQSVLPYMKQRGGGAIVNVSSIYALVGSGASAAYQASKAAVHLLTKTAAVEYARDNIRINSVHPGIIDTPMIANMSTDRYNILVSGTPMGRLGRAEEVARGVVFLASDDASYITGTELVIDGGYTAH
ncbi:SDR family NAD(P)-dependent oxidoreductase [Alicyclobacillus mengziensis]|uniref:Glucose 1-dehydrogenase n=1 Tax=Alicyclobacillus mengziensis TaxID=2931921 RepID=A0A9X7Z6P4_9BACL|nr:glucose 1-dehydrogenase [Alicyclobacillus mengziensis]QSO46576.1 glucose 1-dehydrogenase [Alicyclobacillus mengziensis]